jgi:hypothetical protein
VLAGVALLASGCHKDDPKFVDQLNNPSKSCGLLSKASLTSLTGEAWAAAAMPKRLIRFLATRDARTRLTADNAAQLLDEVNTSVDKYDAAQS